jgi:CheY-like chemotaxis protein
MTILLPIPAIQSQWTSEEPAEETGSLEGLKVLVVEDETDTREMLGEALRSYGASVILSKSSTDALQQIVAETPDLLVSDIGLPNMDGYELLNKIRSELPQNVRAIPAVALTAFVNPSHRNRSAAAGFQAHIAKPVALPDLISTLRKVAGDR